MAMMYKSQIYAALLAFILLEFIRRHFSQANHAFKQFVNLSRICLMKYQGLQCVVNKIDDTSQSFEKNDCAMMASCLYLLQFEP